MNPIKEYAAKSLFSDNGFTIFSKRNKIFKIDEFFNKELIVSLPVGWIFKMLSHSRLLSRIFRLDVYCAAHYADHYFFCFQKKIFSYCKNTQSLQVEHNFQKGNGPIRFTIIENISGFDDGIYFGEYFSDAVLDPIRILKRLPSGNWIECYLFESGKINHVHSLVPDKNNNCVWILTGDFGSASAIFKAKENFSEVIPIVQGQQKFRSCVAFPHEGNLIYATDSHLESNSIRLLSFSKNRWHSKKLFDINGPVIYGFESKDYYIFSTSVEPGDAKSSFIFNLLDTKKGPGIIHNRVEIIAYQKYENTLIKLFLNPKDCWPARLCQFGSAIFAGGSVNNNNFYVYFTGTKNFEGKSCFFDVDSMKKINL